MFRYLNLNNAWPYFKPDGLANEDGAWQLARLPGAPEVIGPPLSAGGLAGPASVGVDSNGDVYYSDPAGDKVLQWNDCDGVARSLACFGGHGSLPGRLNVPRGVVVGPRAALYVADSGNHRIQIVDLRTLELRGIWGQPDPYAEPSPGDEPGRFNDPWDLAADAAGYVYVVDHGNHRVQKFTAGGSVIPAFWESMKSQATAPAESVNIATAVLDGHERLLVLDRGANRVLVYDLEGIYDESGTRRWGDLTAALPAGLAFLDGRLQTGDNAPGRAVRFGPDGAFLGAMLDYHGPVAGLAFDSSGRLFIHGGPGGALTVLLPGQSFARSGTFVGGPFSAGDQPARWGRVQVSAGLPDGAHVQFFACTRPDKTAVTFDPDSFEAAPGQDGIWWALPMDALDFLIPAPPDRYVWLACVLTGNGSASPVIHQIRLAYDEPGLVRYLPAIYGREGDEASRSFLTGTLALFESLLDGVETNIDNLALLFDPQAAPDRPPGGWLDWLAGWLAFDLDETWPEAQRRGALSDAFDLLGRRGTPEGLRQMIAAYAGVDAIIVEPFKSAGIWSLGETSTLGFTTMLASAEAQGAVLNTTATLDRSHLIRESDYGAPLFEDLAHRFCIVVRQSGSVSENAEADIRRVVDREKPAHTVYELSFAGPNMRVGLQAQVGIDTIVAGPPPDLVLGVSQAGQGVLQPASEPASALTGGAIGETARVGRGAILE